MVIFGVLVFIYLLHAEGVLRSRRYDLSLKGLKDRLHSKDHLVDIWMRGVLHVERL